MVPPCITETVADTRRAIADARRAGRTVGLVPTMGALHAGHVSLIRAARNQTNFVVVSIFVNPAQFGPHEDFDRYPRPFTRDMHICAEEGVDLIFHPEPGTLYPSNYHTYVEVHDLQDVLCGAARPGHFRGVATVVLKLFNIVQPDTAFFGQKDAQQVRIIQQMVEDLNVPVDIRMRPILRDSDGLALSSRNQYLDAEQRQQAPVLSRALAEARERVADGERSAEVLLNLIKNRIASAPAAVLDYAAVVDFATLRPVQHLQGRVLVALAVRFGLTRLIDNIMVNL